MANHLGECIKEDIETNSPNGLDLVDSMLLDELVKSQIQLVEHPHHLDGGHFSGHGSKAHDVRKENGNYFWKGLEKGERLKLGTIKTSQST